MADLLLVVGYFGVVEMELGDVVANHSEELRGGLADRLSLSDSNAVPAYCMDESIVVAEVDLCLDHGPIDSDG